MIGLRWIMHRRTPTDFLTFDSATPTTLYAATDSGIFAIRQLK
jgi:hypothetical protein